ncbi:MAG: type I DNA topoisomerase [Clostridia bacterium]|nr:type I DNA topoisomerase [Clostridia bacterium]
MGKKLIIVESPSKADTIKKYLGSTYSVEASVGHIIDLPKSQMGIDVNDDFEPHYITIRGKGEILGKLRKLAKEADQVLLATDPDREGEAISWHLANALGLAPTDKNRVTFNEITKDAVKKAVKEPRVIDQSLVDAQQARRALDRVVGYTLSPILWKKVKKGLSAGRVQSVATRLICDREAEIEAFVPREYWSITAFLNPESSKKKVKAAYYGTNGEKMEIPDEQTASKIVKDVTGKAFTVTDVKQTVSQKSPAPPFTTSTLQQEASRKINFQARKTMSTAQTLYEGVNVSGMGKVGLITYMRTDSVRIAVEAQAAAKNLILDKYGAQYAPKSFRMYKTRKNSQDAHEAIRPANVSLTPEMVKGSLTNDQYKLYKLIWERFVASQMENARVESTTAELLCDKHNFRATGTNVLFDGFMKVYTEGSDAENKEKQTALPPLNKTDKLVCESIEPEQHFTSPPPRYTEATLVKALEEEGIGRPSTYAPTITTILARGYVAREKKSLVPTELGKVTTKLLKENFENIVDVEFTANMETRLDDVESGDVAWKQILRDFYPDFKADIDRAEKELEHVKIADEVSDVQCEKCGRMMVYKLGRSGKFLACPGFPECRNTKSIRVEAGVACPKCGKPLLTRRTRTGKTYYGCEDYQNCDFMTWDTPLKSRTCPKCGKALFTNISRAGRKTVCLNPGCDFEESAKKGGSKK